MLTSKVKHVLPNLTSYLHQLFLFLTEEYKARNDKIEQLKRNKQHQLTIAKKEYQAKIDAINQKHDWRILQYQSELNTFLNDKEEAEGVQLICRSRHCRKALSMNDGEPVDVFQCQKCTKTVCHDCLCWDDRATDVSLCPECKDSEVERQRLKSQYRIKRRRIVY